MPHQPARQYLLPYNPPVCPPAEFSVLSLSLSGCRVTALSADCGRGHVPEDVGATGGGVAQGESAWRGGGTPAPACRGPTYRGTCRHPLQRW